MIGLLRMRSESEAMLDAIGRSQAIIEFYLNGKIQECKREFLPYAWLSGSRYYRKAS